MVEIEEGDDEREVSWWCGTEEAAASSDSPRSLSRSPTHRSGPPIPLIFLTFLTLSLSDSLNLSSTRPRRWASSSASFKARPKHSSQTKT